MVKGLNKKTNKRSITNEPSTESYVLLERTVFIESLLNFERSSILKKAKVDAEAIGDSDEASKVLKTSLITAMEISDEKIIETLLVRLQKLLLETGREFLRKLDY
ncbi:hypothetical protein EYB33_16950 [Lysinibacillus sphaericus]|uniref:hypothetical protein n=1 Tax=Lysinibacillus sphaericus TaxID=1421 RepID=UPI001E4CF960|nr:hypothetical protein [Lysinibacillus sphaericus]UDK97892.1 hypothetical protein EYB33_16950 [Lysinibacillus sphaericus]